MSAGIRLVLAEIDEIGICLKNDWIDPEQAATDLAALEYIYTASFALRPLEQEEPA
jgi:hypothetical protein